MPPTPTGYRQMYALKLTTWRQDGHTIRNSTTSTAASWEMLFEIGTNWSISASSRSLHRPPPSTHYTRCTTRLIKRTCNSWGVHSSVNVAIWSHINWFPSLSGTPSQADGLNTLISTWNGSLRTTPLPRITLPNTSTNCSSWPLEKAAWTLVPDPFSRHWCKRPDLRISRPRSTFGPWGRGRLTNIWYVQTTTKHL